jgi:hypothetical protein
MLAQLARQIQLRRAARARGEDVEDEDDDEDGPRIVLPDDCHVQ